MSEKWTDISVVSAKHKIHLSIHSLSTAYFQGHGVVPKSISAVIGQGLVCSGQKRVST